MLNDLRRSEGRIPDPREACKEAHRAEARVPFAARVFIGGSRRNRPSAYRHVIYRSRGPRAAMSDRRQKLLEGPIAPALIRLAVPIILGNALQTGYQLTDAFWVGRLGASAVAAVAISFPVTFLVIA